MGHTGIHNYCIYKWNWRALTKLSQVTTKTLSYKIQFPCLHYYCNISHLKLQRMQDSAYWGQFLLGIVNISGILSHKIPKYTISLMLFTLTDDPQFYILEVSFSNILMIGLFHSNIRMVSFSKTEKKSYHRKHVRDHTFMTSTWKEGVQWGVLNICHVIVDFFCF